METFHSYLSENHRECDHLLATLEQAVSKGDWDKIREAFTNFFQATITHFEREEKILFPPFEDASGTHEGGPTSCMRSEHDQMRELLSQMDEGCETKDADHFFGLTETFMILVQQHNSKEEQVLYNMAQQFLGDRMEELISTMKEHRA